MHLIQPIKWSRVFITVLTLCVGVMLGCFTYHTQEIHRLTTQIKQLEKHVSMHDKSLIRMIQEHYRGNFHKYMACAEVIDSAE